MNMNKKTSAPTLRDSGKGGFIGRLIRGNSFIMLAFFCSAVIMLLVFYCFDMRPFGDVTILRMDLYHQYGPLFAELYERVKDGGSLLYSWNTGMGGSFLGNFFNYLSSPLLFVIFFFKHADIPDAIALMILLKASFASAAFTYFLKHTQGRHDHVTAAFGVLYSFCGFFIAYYWNVMWIDAMAIFPLVIVGLERILEKRRFLLYTFSLFLVMASNYYMATMVCLFSLVYFFIRYFSSYGIRDTFSGDVKPGLVARVKDSRFIGALSVFGFASLLAAALALFALLPTVFVLRSCSATSGTWPEKYRLYFAVMDFLANHLAGIEPTIRSSGEDVLPNVYCGILTLVLMPLYLLTKSISVKEKTLSVLLLGFLFFSFNLNYLNYIWHGFHFPNDLPYRFSFIYSFVILTLGFRAFTRIKEFSGREVFLAGLGVALFIVIVQKVRSKNVDDFTVLVSLAFTVVYTLILILFRNVKLQETSLALLLLCCVISEAAIANTDHYSMNQEKKHFSGDYEDFAAIKQKLDEYDGGFYRMELANFLRTRMDPAWYNYNGLSTFSSMASERLSNLQSYLGIYGNFINSYTYNAQTPVYNAMTSLKYLVKKTTADGLENREIYDEIFIEETFSAYENNYYLPIAYYVNSSVTDWAFVNRENPFEVQSDYFLRATGVQDVFTKMEVSDVYYNNVKDIYNAYDMGELSFEKENGSSHGSIAVTINSPETRNCYLYVKSRNVDSISVSSEHFNRSQGIDEAYILDLGVCEAGQNLLVDIPIKEDSTYGSVIFYAYGIDMGVFEQGYNILKAGQLNVTVFEDTHIAGTFKARGGGLLYTSIPYDEGWKITVDGQRVPLSDYVRIGDALLGINVTSGDHAIEMKYEPVGFRFSCTVSVLSFIALVAFMILVSILRKRRPVMSPAAQGPVNDFYGNDFYKPEEIEIAPGIPERFGDKAGLAEIPGDSGKKTLSPFPNEPNDPNLPEKAE
ncbi:MAG: YfhO family protein [Oscillospiraceae bacterium]|nr:YfhO family protein [Oscillospiraceae bacterium]